MATVSNRILKGGFFVLFAHVCQKGFTAIFIVIFSQLLTLKLFGELMLAVTLMNLLSLVSLFGLTAALEKFCSGQNRPDLEHVFRTIISLAFLTTGAVSILVWLASEPIAAIFSPSPGFALLMGFTAVGIFTQGAFRVCYETLRARENGMAYFAVENLLSVCKLVLPIAAYFAFDSVAAILGGLALAYAVSALAVVLKLKTEGLTPRMGSALNRSTPAIVRFALPAWIAGFTYVFAQHVDKLMLGALSETETVGLYAAASAVAMMLTLFHTAFAGIFAPIASDLARHDNKDELHAGCTWVCKWSIFTCGAGLLLLAGFGDHLLRLFGTEYATAEVHTVLVLLGFFYLSGSTLGPAGIVLQMCGSNGLESINAAAFLVLNITANFLLIPLIGIRGAALATLLAGLARLLLQWTQLQRRHGLQIVSRASFSTSAMIVAFVLAAALSPMFSLARAGFAILGLLILCVFQWFRLDAKERGLIHAYRNQDLTLTQLVKKAAS